MLIGDRWWMDEESPARSQATMFRFQQVPTSSLSQLVVGWLMATLLRKLCVCETASWKQQHRSSSASSPASHGLGAFDPLPADILMRILRLLHPKQAAQLSLVCKCWRSLVSDNGLWAHFLQAHQPQPWDSLLFAETNLTSAYPLPLP